MEGVTVPPCGWQATNLVAEQEVVAGHRDKR